MIVQKRSKFICDQNVPCAMKKKKCKFSERCIDFIPYTKRNLCDHCKHEIPTCKASERDVLYGDGKGLDNIIECKYYKQQKEGSKHIHG